MDGLGELQNFAQLFSSLERELIQDQRRIIGSLELRGLAGDILELPPEEIATLSLSELGTANFHTISLKEFAASEIGQTKNFLPAAVEGFEKVSEALSAQELSDGLLLLGELTTGLQMFLTAVQNIQAAFEINFDEVKDSDNKSMNENIIDLKNILTDMVDGLENKDFVLVNDYLTYELLPHLKSWDGKLDIILEAIA